MFLMQASGGPYIFVYRLMYKTEEKTGVVLCCYLLFLIQLAPVFFLFITLISLSSKHTGHNEIDYENKARHSP